MSRCRGLLVGQQLRFDTTPLQQTTSSCTLLRSLREQWLEAGRLLSPSLGRSVVFLQVALRWATTPPDQRRSIALRQQE